MLRPAPFDGKSPSAFLCFLSRVAHQRYCGVNWLPILVCDLVSCGCGSAAHLPCAVQYSLQSTW